MRNHITGHLNVSKPVGSCQTISQEHYYKQGKDAYDAGERWLSACHHADGSWQKEAWQAGFWARRSECQPAMVQVRGV